MDKFKVGDRVRLKPDLPANVHRRGQSGTIVAIHNPPAQGALVVEVRFEDGEIERGIRIHRIERA